MIKFLPLLVEQRVGGVEIWDLPCLASERNSNLTSDDMADIRSQGIDVNVDNCLSPRKPDEVPQMEEG